MFRNLFAKMEAEHLLFFTVMIAALPFNLARPKENDQEPISVSCQDSEAHDAHQLAGELKIEENEQCNLHQHLNCDSAYTNIELKNEKLKDNSKKSEPKGIQGYYDYRKVTPLEIDEEIDRLIEIWLQKYEEVWNIPLSQVTFNNVIKTVADLEYEIATFGNPLIFAQHVALDKQLRESSSNALKKLAEFGVEISMKKELFDRVVYFNEKFGEENLNNEQKRLVEKMIRNGKRSGLNLTIDIQDHVREIKKRISDLQIRYQRCLNEDNTKLYFTSEELAGMPDDFINDLSPSYEGKYEVTLKYPHLYPIIKQCRVPGTRRQMVTADLATCMEENTLILEELILQRQNKAELLGFNNHASYVLEDKMAREPEAVQNFLSDILNKLQPLWFQEQEDMLKMKKNECEMYGYEFSGKIDYWDFRYYMNKIKEKVYTVDRNEIKQYFPIEKVTSGLLHIYEVLLGLSFTVEPDAQTWHDDVKLYRVSYQASNELLGYFFLDLHPREGKYGHAAVFGLQPSCITPDGDRQVAVCAMVCNFATPTSNKPALLYHSEVKTFFHEFGHAMHYICSQPTSSSFTGFSVEDDFIEAPSQMLENWVWEKESLNFMSGHYQNGSTLPDDMVGKLQRSRKANVGVHNLRQIVLATFDQEIHTHGVNDTKVLFSKLFEDMMGIETIPNTNLAANFAHLVGGYDAKYYGYLWSEVFAMDMYASRFKKEGILNSAIGKEYRDKILQPGATKDAEVLLRNFLGREPNNDAFLISKGLSS